MMEPSPARPSGHRRVGRHDPSIVQKVIVVRVGNRGGVPVNPGYFVSGKPRHHRGKHRCDQRGVKGIPQELERIGIGQHGCGDG